MDTVYWIRRNSKIIEVPFKVWNTHKGFKGMKQKYIGNFQYEP